MSELLDMQELKEHVRVNSKSGIVTCLSQLRNEPLRCKNFIKHGGLNILVNLLRNPHSTILNMCLSILANACISSDAREKIRDSNIGDNIIHIMKNHALDSTVHCRVCRLVGNLSECSWHAKSLYNNGVVEPLTTFLKLKTTRQTYLMAIRAIRNIWSVYKGSREKIIHLQAVRQIAQLFVMANEKTKVNTKYTELVDVCLKAMCTFLVTQDENADLVRSCSAQMEADKDKQGYKILIECCKVGNNLAIKCLCSLCLLMSCRLVLGTLGAAELLITLTKNGSTNGELSRQLLVSLCLFCQESVHRMKMKAAGLEVFVILLKRPQLEKYHFMLLDALMQFAYCDNSIITLTKHGLVEVLMTKLMDSIADTAVLDETSELRPVNNINASNKRCYGSTPCRKYSRISEGRYNRYYTLHRFDGDSSPGSSTSVSSSPPSTPPLLYYDSMMETDIDDDNYSPVYSDTEWGDDEEPQDEEADSLKSCKSLIINADNSRDSEKTSTGIFCVSIVLMLLHRVSLLPLPIDRLADPMTIKSLLIYINRTKHEKAITILNRIVRNPAYFMPLLKQGFVFDAQGMPEREEYLHHLREVAETGGAIGQLSSMLLRGEEQHKLIFAVSIPFLIVQSRVTLRSLLHNHGGLQMILRLLSDPTHELHERAIWSICRLAVSLQIQPETVDKCSMSASDSLSFRTCIRDNHNPLPLSIVTFELDDGTTVDACRSILCQRSDAFSAMLEDSWSDEWSDGLSDLEEYSSDSELSFNCLLNRYVF
ncbi:uncharacterized protein LOC116851238 isoform X2 [Odontomachus brunneus]|uniref:uncharacterized protein LOC116851238 isoform X2 n=1 Tax=Odontomachus brunneus TaxID=486640 RepID=UPI0013F22178|nr:uncharacterized protein LOC116851238 isoform X2 [Odontomachus brunneus]